jgi:hypothetical protein
MGNYRDLEPATGNYKDLEMENYRDPEPVRGNHRDLESLLGEVSVLKTA